MVIILWETGLSWQSFVLVVTTDNQTRKKLEKNTTKAQKAITIKQINWLYVLNKNMHMHAQ